MGMYQFNRWAEPPIEMVRELVWRTLRESHHYAGVNLLTSNSRGDYVVQGNLYDFKEISGTALAARVSMELELRDSKTGATVWTHEYTHDEPVSGKGVPGVVPRALNKNVQRGVDEAATKLERILCGAPAEIKLRIVKEISLTEFLPEWLEQVRDVLETLNQGVIITDECPRIVYSNAEFQNMIGRNEDELVGQYVKELVPPEDVPFLLSQIGLGRIQGQARFEFYLPQGAGGRLPVVIAARQLEDPDGRLFAVVTATDIAEQKKCRKWICGRRIYSWKRANARWREDLLLAARVQQSLSPVSLAWGASSVETYYQAARTIGGDFGLASAGDDYLTLLVCDVSGHGIGSALVANRIYTETISLIEGGVALTPMLQQLNRFVMHNLGSFFMYFTLAGARQP